MAHIHGAKVASNATAAKLMNSTMANMGKMSEAMKHPMAQETGKGIAAGIAATAGKSTLKKVLTHPVTLIGFGFVLGYLAYQCRKDIPTASDEE